jgi:phenylacetate-CoA ligase
MLKSVEGRNDDTIITPTGRHVSRLDPVFKSDLPIVEAQVIQDASDHLLVQVVPAPGYNRSTEAALVKAICERVDDMRIDVRKVSVIPRGPNGKFKAVVRLPFRHQFECPEPGLEATSCMVSEIGALR